MTRLAIFEDEPQAQQAAMTLREEGFHADVVVENAEDYGEAIKRFFLGQTSQGFRGNVLLRSDDAEAEPFDRVVTRQYGRVITGTVE